MKVIAQTALGYLVEANAGELALAAGFTNMNEVPWAQGRGWSSGRDVPIGTEIKVVAIHTFVREMHAKEASVPNAVKALRAYADALEAGIPQLVITPPESPDV